LHIFVRPEIRSLEDLRGKKVNFNTQGTAAAYSGPLIFSRLGLNVEKMFIPHQWHWNKGSAQKCRPLCL